MQDEKPIEMQQTTEEDLEHIRGKIIDYLSRQGFSEKKLICKVTDLRRRYPHTARYRSYTKANVQRVIDQLKEEGLVDERAYAEDVLRQLKDKKDGLLRIKEKMYRRLIDPHVIEAVLQDFQSQGIKQNYDKIVREVFRKKEALEQKVKSKKETRLVVGKLYAFLAHKGYTPDDIREILKRASIF